MESNGELTVVTRFVWCVLAAVGAFYLSSHAPVRAQTLLHSGITGCRADVARYDVAVPADPAGIAVSADGRSAFVALSSANPASPNGIGVLKCSQGRYRLARVVPLETEPFGIALTHDEQVILVADDGFVAFLSAPAALAGRPALLGYIQDDPGDVEDNDPGSIYVNVTPDDGFGFVSDEGDATITVINLAQARRDGFSRAAIVGKIPVGYAPVALRFSRDGKYLLTTSEIAPSAWHWPNTCHQEGVASTARQRPSGAVIVIDIAKAEIDPKNAVVVRVQADCSPVRLSLSPDGATTWVTNRESGTLIAFSTSRLISGAADARLATLSVGSNPVPVAVTTDGRYVLVGATNRFGPGGAALGKLLVVDAVRKRVVGQFSVGRFPREFAVGAGDEVLLSNNRSDTLTIFDASRLQELLPKH